MGFIAPPSELVDARAQQNRHFDIVLPGLMRADKQGPQQEYSMLALLIGAGADPANYKTADQKGEIGERYAIPGLQRADDVTIGLYMANSNVRPLPESRITPLDIRDPYIMPQTASTSPYSIN